MLHSFHLFKRLNYFQDMPLSTYNVLLKLITFIFLISNVYCPKSNESESNDEPLQIFMPVDVEWQVSKCNELNLPFIEVSSKELHYKFLKSPKIKIETKGDGSCFFNALSYWVTGSDEFGQELCKKIIDFLADSKNFKLMTLDYKWQKRIDEMHDSRVYAESSEIAAAAEYLKTSIYVYTDDNGWNFFNKDDVFGNDSGEKCIYLINKGEHFMTVVDTTKPSAPIEEKSEIAAAAKYLKTPICVYTDYDGWKLFNKNFVVENDENEKFIYLIYDKEQYTPVINVRPVLAFRNPV